MDFILLYLFYFIYLFWFFLLFFLLFFICLRGWGTWMPVLYFGNVMLLVMDCSSSRWATICKEWVLNVQTKCSYPTQWCYLFAFMIHCFQSCSRREYSLNTAHMTVSNTLVYQSIFLSIQHNRFLKELNKYLWYFLNIKIVLIIIYWCVKHSTNHDVLLFENTIEWKWSVYNCFPYNTGRELTV